MFLQNVLGDELSISLFVRLLLWEIELSKSV